MPGCEVLGCTSRTSRKTNHQLQYEQDRSCKITFHKFPQDTTQKNEWIDAINRKGWQPTRNSRVCSLHFAEDCFKVGERNKVLLREFKPTLNLNPRPRRAKVTPSPIMDDSDSEDEMPAALFAKAILEEDENLNNAEDDKNLNGSEDDKNLIKTKDDKNLSNTEDDKTLNDSEDTEMKPLIPEHHMLAVQDSNHRTDFRQGQPEVFVLNKLKGAGATVSPNFGKSPFASQIKSLQGSKVRCFAVNASGLNYLCKKGIMLKPQPVESTDEMTTDTIGEENFISDTTSSYETCIETLKNRVASLEAECLTLQATNSRLQAERNMAQYASERLKDEYDKLMKECQNLENLNKQLTSDNAELLETLSKSENNETSGNS